MLYGQITSAFGVGEIVKTLEANRRKPIDKAQQPSGRTRRRFHNPLKTLSLGGYLMTRPYGSVYKSIVRILQAINMLSDRLLLQRKQEEVGTMDTQHSNRRGLAGEHPFTDLGQLLIYPVLLITWITDSFIFRYSVFLAVHVPAYIRFPIGITILFASALLVLSAHKALFGEPAGKPRLITTGAFALVRHPLYFGSWLFSVGLVIITFSASSVFVSLVILLFHLLMARYEERLLLRKLGDEYREYQVRVSMFFPVKFGRRLAQGTGLGARSAEVPGRTR